MSDQPAASTSNSTDFSARPARAVAPASSGGAPRVALAMEVTELADVVALVWRSRDRTRQALLWSLTHAAEALGVGRVSPLVASDGTRMRWHLEPRQWVEVLP